MKRKIEVTPHEMRKLREQGMTNKQIAASLECSPQTVYRYIGKRSFDVANAAAQNKPCPVKLPPLDKPDPIEPEETTMDFEVISKAFEQQYAEATQKATEEKQPEQKQPERTNVEQLPRRTMPAALRLVSEAHRYNFQGCYCDYEINTGAGTIEMTASEGEAVISGIIDLKSIPDFIEELRAIHAFTFANSAQASNFCKGA